MVKKKMKVTLLVLFTLVLLAGCSVQTHTEDGERIFQASLGSVASESSNQIEAAKMFAEKVKEYTNDSIKINVFPGGTYQYQTTIQGCGNTYRLCKDAFLSERASENQRLKSNGYFRRFLIVPFKVQIPKSEVDPKLAEKIVSTELPGIMNWMLEGRKRLITQSGFTESSLCQKQLEEEYRYGSGVRKKVNLILPEGFKL